MPSVSSNQFFVTISHSDVDNLKGTTEYIKHVKKDTKKHLVVKELGKQGKHPHYHIYVEYDNKTRTDNYTKQLKTQYFTELDPVENKRAIVVKSVYDVSKLVGMYFQKEEGYEVVANKSVDLDYYKKQCKIKAVKPSYKFITFNELPFFIIEQIQKNENIISLDDYNISKRYHKDSDDQLDWCLQRAFNLTWNQLFTVHKYNMHSYHNKKDTVYYYVKLSLLPFLKNKYVN